MPSNFPIIQGLLREFVDDDITSGFKELLQSIHTSWKSPADEMERKHHNAWKKLSPEQHAALLKLFTSIRDQLLVSPEASFDIRTVTNTVNDKAEAICVVTGIITMAAQLGEIDKNFINNAHTALSDEEFDQFKEQALTFDVLPFNTNFVADKADLFKSIFIMDEEGVFDRQRVSALLRHTLEQTPSDGPKGANKHAAAVGVHYFLHKMKTALRELLKRVEAEFVKQGFGGKSQGTEMEKIHRGGKQQIKDIATARRKQAVQAAQQKRGVTGAAAQAEPQMSKSAQDAVAALVKMGQGQDEAHDGVSDAVKALGQNATSASLIKFALNPPKM